MNKRAIAVCVVLMLCSVSVWAVGFLGTPTAEIGQNKWTIGYDYSYSSQDFKSATVRGSWLEIENGVPFSGVERFKAKFKDFNIQRHYATIGYGITEDWDIYVKLGIADVKGKDREEGDDKWGGANFDNDFAWGWGTRYTFHRDGNVSWGAALQMNWLDTEWSKKYSESGSDWSDTWTDKIEFESYDVLVSVGPTVDMGGWQLYGGPFYYYINADWTLTDKGVYMEPGFTADYKYKESADLKSRSNFGGFIGANFDLATNLNMTIELASTTRCDWGLGAGIAYKF